MISTARTNAGEMLSRTDRRASISMSRTLAISSRMFMPATVFIQVELWRESFTNKKCNIANTIPPGLQLLFTDPIRIIDKDFPEPHGSISNGFDLDLFAEGHPVAAQCHLAESVTVEHPHTRLGVAHPPKEKQ